jgi:predicted DNA-binding transcriptional regulator YafY
VLSGIFLVMRASRLVALLLLLQARGQLTADELAAELGVSGRTIQRDVDALTEAGIPVYAERGRAGGYRLVQGYRASLTALDAAEARALVAFGAAGPAGDLGLGQALMSARLKLAASLPATLREQAADAAGRFHLDAPGWFSSKPAPRCLTELATAVFGDLEVDARYRRGPGSRDCRLQPLGLVLKAGTWYLVATEAGPEPLVYRADRFDHAAASDRRFRRPAGFDLARFWARWRDEFERSLPLVWVTVLARPACISGLRRVVEPGYAAQVRWDVAANATGRARLDLPFEKLEYARAALLGFGPDVEVVGPDELRRQMTEAAAGLRALYLARRPKLVS